MSPNQIRRRVLKLSITHFCDVSGKVQIMSSQIHQIVNKKLFGHAFTIDTNDNINTVIIALEMCKPNDVLVITGNNSGKALAGEIFATIAKRNKLAGIVINGACRDIDGIKKVGLPFYAKAIYPSKASDSKKSAKFNVPIICDKVTINPNDIIFGDENGIIVIAEKDFLNILALAEAALQKEKQWLNKINAGAKLADVFK